MAPRVTPPKTLIALLALSIMLHDSGCAGFASAKVTSTFYGSPIGAERNGTTSESVVVVAIYSYVTAYYIVYELEFPPPVIMNPKAKPFEKLPVDSVEKESVIKSGGKYTT